MKDFNKRYQQIINKIHNDNSESDQLAELGPGIQSYHNLLVLLFLLFLALTLLYIPVINIYKNSNFYEDTFAKYSLGNFGFSSTECSIGRLDELNLKCKAG